MAYSGYKQIYMPDYYCATKTGYVAEHRYVAEQKLGRHLKKGEVIHHIDKNRFNNKPDNIIVFKTAADRNRYNLGGVLVEENDGAYTSYYEKPKQVCMYCGRVYTPYRSESLYCSRECATLAQRKKPRPTKQQLKMMILEFSMSQVAQIYGVSDNCIRRWCMMYKLPFKHSDIKRMRDREQIKKEQKRLEQEKKKRQKESDELRAKNIKDMM